MREPPNTHPLPRDAASCVGVFALTYPAVSPPPLLSAGLPVSLPPSPAQSTPAKPSTTPASHRENTLVSSGTEKNLMALNVPPAMTQAPTQAGQQQGQGQGNAAVSALWHGEAPSLC